MIARTPHHGIIQMPLCQARQVFDFDDSSGQRSTSPMASAWRYRTEFQLVRVSLYRQESHVLVGLECRLTAYVAQRRRPRFRSLMQIWPLPPSCSRPTGGVSSRDRAGRAANALCDPLQPPGRRFVWRGRLLAEREHVCLDAGCEERDLEGAVGDGSRLTDQLIEPLLGDGSAALFVGVEAVSGRWEVHHR